MKDVIKFHYIEAQLEITCTVCNVTTMYFPDMDEDTFLCPKCHRGFKLNYSIEIIPENKIIKENLKPYIRDGIR
jgi:hypothetical protein